METIHLKDTQLDSVTGGTQLPYLVKAGDTLASLAQKYHCSVEQLCRWNNLENADQLTVGQKLTIKF